MKGHINLIAIVGIAFAMGASSQNANAFNGSEQSSPYTLTCTAAGGTTAFTLDASAYSFQIAPTASIGGQTGGAGGGKVIFEPATVTVPASEVTAAVASSLVGGTFSSCSLIPTGKGSTLPSFTLNLVIISGYSFVAPRGDDDNNPKHEGKVTLTLQYGGLATPASSGN